MQDPPTAAELLAAARQHLELEVLPALAEPRLRFQTLVAANVLAVVERELAYGEAQLEAEWQRLNALAGSDRPLPAGAAVRAAALQAARRALCDQIRAGQFDQNPARQALLRHLRETVADKLRVANPKFLGRVSRGAA
jgi:hypothetical protein